MREKISRPRSRISWIFRGQRIYQLVHVLNQNSKPPNFKKCVLCCIIKHITDSYYNLLRRSIVFNRVAYLIFELGDLSLAGGVTLQVVQHNLCICQQDFGSLQVFLQPLLCLHILLAHLKDKTLLSNQNCYTYSPHLLRFKSSFFPIRRSGTTLNPTHVTALTETRSRVVEVPGPGRSAVWTPAPFSRATLSACLHTPPPAVPPSVSAAGHMHSVSGCTNRRSVVNRVRHNIPSTILLDMAALTHQRQMDGCPLSRSASF